MNPSLRHLLSAFIVISVAAPVFAQRDLKDIPPPDPELERKTFILPEGFEVNLYASDPQIAKPIQMNFDPQGRLWIASSETYPQVAPGKKANDRIVVVEDKDGDGTADKTTVFADGLLIPTGVEPGDGGAYVGASTELLHFVDNDGDLKADEKRVVLSGFGTEDTHHILHTLRWGPESLLYFNQSIYIHSHIETPWGVKRLNAGGIWQYRPETMELDIIMKGLVNSWGTAFDQHGHTFATDGAGGEGINYIVPGAYYLTAFQAPRILHGLNPGSPKHCSLEIVESEHLPDDWNGSAITNDFRGHRVCRFVLTDDGSGFRSQEQQEVIKSNHVAFRPVDVKLGPDGAIYIADWYNPIIQHGEVDFRDPRRDHTHGRIWRVSYKGKPKVKLPKLTELSDVDLLEQLRSPNRFNRQQAKRVIKERADKIGPALTAWSTSFKPADEQLKLEALWMFLGIDVPNVPLLEELLKADNGHVRAGATRVLGHWLEEADNAELLLGKLVDDEHAAVRLEAIRVLATIPKPESMKTALRVLDHPMDRWLDYALWLTVRDLQPVWEPAIVDGSLKIENLSHLAFLMKSSGSSASIPALVEKLNAGEVAPRDLANVFNVISASGTPDHLNRLLAFAVAEDRDDATQVSVLRSLHQSKKPPSDVSNLTVLLNDPNTNVRTAALQCVGLWKRAEHREHLIRTVDNDDYPIAEKLAALSSEGAFNDKPAIDSLTRFAGKANIAIQQRAINDLLKLRPQLGAKLAAEYLSNVPNSDHAGPVFRSIVGRKGGADQLAKAIASKTISKDVAVIGLRILNSSGQGESALAAQLRTAGKVDLKPIKLTSEEMAKLIANVKEHGNAAIGEAIFRRTELGCMKCHSIGPAGGKVGSNLVSLGATAQLDYIIESLLDPNAKVKEGFHTIVVATEAGQVYSGVKSRESETHIYLRDAEGKEAAIAIDEIEQQKQGSSLMPAGLMANLTSDELIHMVAFLSSLGREPEYTVGTKPVLRHWEALQATPEAAHRLRRTSYTQATSDDKEFKWQRRYSKVNGALPLNELPTVVVRKRLSTGTQGVSFVRTKFTTTGGMITFKLNQIDGLQAWVDGQPVKLLGDIPSGSSAELQSSYRAGEHQLTLAIDQTVRTEPVRIEIGKGSEKITLPTGP